MLKIHLLGDFRLTYEDTPVDALSTGRVQSLLAYLVLHRASPQSRQHLAFSFWPDSRGKQARSNLRTLLYHLRQALPDPDRFLDVDATSITWRADAPCSVDVAAFEASHRAAEEALQRGDFTSARTALERAADLYQGDLLPSCYDDWILPERERLHQRCMWSLERLTHLCEDERNYPEAVRHAERLLQHDPLREPSYRILMQMHALNGDRASVERAYQTCVSALRNELDLDPEHATHTLYEQLMRGEDGNPGRPHQATGQPLQASTVPGTLPLVGRQEAWKKVRASWHTAMEEGARLIVISGVAGIGKTRLADELFTWASRQGIDTARAQAYAAEGRPAYGAVTEWLRSASIQSSLSHLDAVWLAEVARLLPELRIEHEHLLASGGPMEPWQRRRLFEALARAVLSTGRPLLLLLDDLQWSDDDTLEWLRFLLRFAPEARLLVVGTLRSEALEPDHAVHALLLDLGRDGAVTELALDPLDEARTTELASQVAGGSLEAEEARLLYRETEGNPLFVIESVQAGRSAAEPSRSNGERDVPPAPSALPPTVHSVIRARLFQLSPVASEVVGVAATVGRTFSVEVLLHAGDLDEASLTEALDELWRRRILSEQAPDHYDFTHGKLREVAYAELSPARRRHLHRRIAQALDELHAPDADTFAAQIAVHYEQGGRHERAIVYYHRAAKVAQDVYAYEEAVRLLRCAVAQLEHVPASQAREERELTLLTALGPALSTTRGWAHPDVGATYERAHQLCGHLEATEQFFPSLWGLWTFRLVRAELPALRALTAQLLQSADEMPSNTLAVAAHLSGFFNTFFLGEMAEAQDHLDAAFALPPSDRAPAQVLLMSADEWMFCHCCAAHLQWFLGHPDNALRYADDALALADASAHPFNRATARCYVAMLHQYRREHDAVEEHVAVAQSLCDEHGFAYYGAWCTIMKGWVRTESGSPLQGIEQMHRGLEALRRTGAVLREPYYLVLLSEACLREGQIDRGLALVAEAFDAVQRSGEHWIEAELHRLRGELLLAKGAEQQAATHFKQAENLAARQQARSLELRAAMSRSRLWHRQGKTAAARRHLQSVYDGFAEGHDTPDLKEAAALLMAWG